MNDFQSVSLFYILSITHPSQGFLNALVFFRPSYLKYRYRDEKEWRLASICRVLHIPVPRLLVGEWCTSLRSNRYEVDVEYYGSRIERNNEDAKPGVVDTPRSAWSKSLVNWKEEEEKVEVEKEDKNFIMVIQCILSTKEIHLYGKKISRITSLSTSWPCFSFKEKILLHYVPLYFLALLLL